MKSWKIYSIVITVVLALVIIGICLYAFVFKENISEQNAKEIALTDAGVNESNITLRKVELDVEHYDPIYEIEFYYNNVEYDYEIDAITGEITKYERKK